MNEVDGLTSGCWLRMVLSKINSLTSSFCLVHLLDVNFLLITNKDLLKGVSLTL